MKISLPKNTNFCGTIKQQWAKWQAHKRYYPNTVMWMQRYRKGKVKQLFVSERVARRRDRNRLENFYYEAMYDAIGTSTTLWESRKVKYNVYTTGQITDFCWSKRTRETGKEQPTLYHLVKQWTRKQLRHISEIEVGEGNICRTTREIIITFSEKLRVKFDSTQAAELAIIDLLEGVKVKKAQAAHMSE
jgi:hypothetical protein